MRTLLTLFISTIKLVWRKFRAAGILFVVLLIVGPIGFALYQDKADDYAYEIQYEIGRTKITGVSVSLISEFEAVEAHFSEYELDETYGKKQMYQVEVEVANVGVNPICISRDFNGFYVENDSGDMVNFNVFDYYYEMDDYDRLDTVQIPSARYNTVCFLFVFDEDDVPSKLTFYDGYEGEKLFDIDIPAPK